MDGTSPLIACDVNEDLEDVSSACATVQVRVSWINRHTIDEFLILGQLAINVSQFARRLVYCPEFNRVVMARDETITNGVEKLDILTFLLKLVRCRAIGL